MKSYKFRIYPSKKQEKEIRTHLWIAKGIWNDLLDFSKRTYNAYDYFPTKNTLQLMVKDTGLYSQVAQEVAHRVSNSTFRVFKIRKQGRECGFPRFKSFDRMKSLHYPQSGFKLEDKITVSPFGTINIKKHRSITGKIKTMTIKREPSGKWFAIFTTETPTPEYVENTGSQVGIDLGLKTLAALSNGQMINNPRHLKKHEAKLARLQQLVSRKKKGSKNKIRAKFKVARCHEKVANTRMDYLHKETTKLVNSYSLIAMEKLASQDMAENHFGKSINDAGWGMFASMINYKAESAGCHVVFVDPKNTTQMCSGCHQLVKKELCDRIHSCPYCKLTMDRDTNAAINILQKATVGTTGINACGEEALASSMKHEAPTLASVKSG
jgi:putative transposase